MAHFHAVADNDFYFSIDAESRAITYLGESSPIISQTDHNSEYFTFEMPRYIEGHDMLQCDTVQVHFINISSESAITRNIGVYTVTDLQLDPEDDKESTLLCSWLISQNATLLVGSLSFALRFACTSGSKVDYSWSTAAYTGVAITSTINNSGMIVEQYNDVLQAWYNELLMAGTMGVNIVTDAQNKALEAVAAAEQAAIDRMESTQIIHEVSDEVLEEIQAEGDSHVAKVNAARSSAISAINSAEQKALVNIANAEAVVLKDEREELVSELVDRLMILTGSNYYLRAEGVSV